jgi:hypothetical protein
MQAQRLEANLSGSEKRGYTAFCNGPDEVKSPE